MKEKCDQNQFTSLNEYHRNILSVISFRIFGKEQFDARKNQFCYIFIFIGLPASSTFVVVADYGLRISLIILVAGHQKICQVLADLNVPIFFFLHFRTPYTGVISHAEIKCRKTNNYDVVKMDSNNIYWKR